MSENGPQERIILITGAYHIPKVGCISEVGEYFAVAKVAGAFQAFQATDSYTEAGVDIVVVPVGRGRPVYYPVHPTPPPYSGSRRIEDASRAPQTPVAADQTKPCGRQRLKYASSPKNGMKLGSYGLASGPERARLAPGWQPGALYS